MHALPARINMPGCNISSAQQGQEALTLQAWPDSEVIGSRMLVLPTFCLGL